MSMQPRLWSINALSTEFNLDRRTVSKRLTRNGVRPASMKRGAPMYHLAEAALALQAPPEREPPSSPGEPKSFQDAVEEITHMRLRSCFAFAKPIALVLHRKTKLRAEEILELVGEIFREFDRLAEEFLGYRSPLRGLPLELFNDDSRSELLAELEALKAQKVGSADGLR